MKKYIACFLIFSYILYILPLFFSIGIAYADKPDVLRMIPYLIASGIVFRSAEAAHEFAMYCLEKLPQEVIDNIMSGFTITYETASAIRDLLRIHFDLGTGYIKNSYISYRNYLNPVTGGADVVGDVFDMALADPNLFATYGPWYYIDLQIPSGFTGIGDDRIEYSCMDGDKVVRAFSIALQSSTHWSVRGGTRTSDYVLVSTVHDTIRLRVRNRYNRMIWREAWTGSNWSDIGIISDYVSGSTQISTAYDIVVNGNAGYEDVEYELTAENIGIGEIIPESALEGRSVIDIPDIESALNLNPSDVLTDVPVSGFLESILSVLSSIASVFTTGLVGDITAIQYSKLSNLASVVTTKFPFSLPWDLKRSLSSLDVGYTSKPTFEIPIFNPFGSTQYVDFSIPDEFDRFVVFVRSSFVFIFAVSLIYLTPKLIGGDR